MGPFCTLWLHIVYKHFVDIFIESSIRHRTIRNFSFLSRIWSSAVILSQRAGFNDETYFSNTTVGNSVRLGALNSSSLVYFRADWGLWVKSLLRGYWVTAVSFVFLWFLFLVRTSTTFSSWIHLFLFCLMNYRATKYKNG